MTLKSFRFGGYKGYKNDTEVVVSPLTLIYGQNSAGKSSLIRMLPLLKNTVANEDVFPFGLTERLTRTATLGDLFSKFRADGLIHLELKFIEANDEITIKYDIKNFDRDLAVILKFSVESERINFVIDLDMTQPDPLALATRKYIYPGKEASAEIQFVGLKPTFSGSLKDDIDFYIEVLRLQSLLGQMENVQWLGPMRKTVPRIERINRAIRTIDDVGNGASQILYADSVSGGRIYKRVNAWFEAYCGVGLEIVAGAHTFGSLASLAFVRKGSRPVLIPIEDTGEGMSQVLPVLVLGAMAAEGDFGSEAVICIEHPDLHLHSNAHYGVIDFLVECVKSSFKPRFIIESHSEAILTAAQLAIMNGDLKADDYVAYQVCTDDEGVSTADAVRLKSDGSPLDERHLVLDWFGVAHNKAMELARKKIMS